MKKEDLTAKGLSEEQAAEVLKIYAEEMKGFIPKARFDELNETKKSLEGQIADRDKQLKDLKDNAGDNEALKKQIDDLQKANKAEKEKYDADILRMEKTAAIKDALAGATHPELLLSQFDLEKIQKNADGSFSGISEQLEGQKKAFPDLFKTTVTGKNPENRGKSVQTGGSGGDRAAELQKLIDDPKTKLVERIAARNELMKLQKESEE